MLLTREEWDGGEVSQPIILGPLELSVMDVIWRLGLCQVRDVIPKLDRHLAYTTIMTTMDRLFKKGLLDRRRRDRAFLYSARLSREQWERQRAGDLLATFLAGPRSQDVLLSFLVDAVNAHDPRLLEELEKKIQSKRQALSKQSAKAK